MKNELECQFDRMCIHVGFYVISLNRGDEFLNFQKLVSQKFPFTPK